MRSLAIAALVLVATPAYAEDSSDDAVFNALAGPVLGLHWGGGRPAGLAAGLEGGVGWAPWVRVNLGFEQRGDGPWFYGSVDPWFLVGATVGYGRYGHGRGDGMVGLWEGIPLAAPGCGDHGLGAAASLAIGYRYNGVHELYATIKGGISERVCIDL